MLSLPHFGRNFLRNKSFYSEKKPRKTTIPSSSSNSNAIAILILEHFAPSSARPVNNSGDKFFSRHASLGLHQISSPDLVLDAQNVRHCISEGSAQPRSQCHPRVKAPDKWPWYRLNYYALPLVSVIVFLNMGLINEVDMVCLSPVGYGV